MSLIDLSGKVALVSGSSRGIGWSAAELLASNGATVVIHGNSDSSIIDARAAELRDRFGGEHSGFQADVRDPNQIRGVARSVFAKFKRLDILINNAGILDDALIGMISDDAIAKTFEVNTLAAIHFLQAGARLMKRHHGGSIVNVSSIVGIEGNPGQIVYSSSKAALVGLTKSAAKELAPAQIRVNAIAPGFIDTQMARQLPEAIFAERVASIGMGRIGTAEDIAKVILFLSSDLSSYVTGQIIGVNGGMII